MHRKAQELLSIAVSSSDVSNASTENINIIDEKVKKHLLRNNKIPNEPKNDNKKQIREKLDGKHELQITNNEEVDDNKRHKIKDNMQKNIKKSKSSPSMVEIKKGGIVRHGR